MFEYDYVAPVRAPEPEGLPIGGWLILPALALLLAPFIFTLGLVGLIGELSLAVDFGYGTAHFSNIVAQTTLLVFLLFTMVRFFGKKRNAPALMITLYALLLFSDVVLLFIEVNTGAEIYAETTIQNVRRSGIGALIWIPYFLTSQRVKATFVR